MTSPTVNSRSGGGNFGLNVEADPRSGTSEEEMDLLKQCQEVLQQSFGSNFQRSSTMMSLTTHSNKTTQASIKRRSLYNHRQSTPQDLGSSVTVERSVSFDPKTKESKSKEVSNHPRTSSKESKSKEGSPSVTFDPRINPTESTIKSKEGSPLNPSSSRSPMDCSSQHTSPNPKDPNHNPPHTPSVPCSQSMHVIGDCTRAMERNASFNTPHLNQPFFDDTKRSRSER